MTADLRNMYLEEQEEVLKRLGEAGYRGRQLFGWMRRPIKGIEEISNFSRELQKKLKAEGYEITYPEQRRRIESELDGTVKYLWGYADGVAVESVLMRYKHGNTVCVSTQAGCGMGCRFCASGIGGLERNLSAAEILEQIIFTSADTGEKVTGIVLMGTGEPLDNMENVLRFLRIVTHKEGLNIGMRHITLSTCGIAERIDKLSEYELQLTLSVSLHAADDETRDKLMPVNRRTGVDKLLSSCRRYYEKTGRRVTYEYAVIEGLNDSEQHVRELAKRMKEVGGHVNLIRLNRVEERGYRGGNTEEFAKKLKKESVNVTIRRRLGTEIEAACGQLRRGKSIEMLGTNR